MHYKCSIFSPFLCLPYLMVLKSRSIWWAGHVAHVEGNKCIRKSEGTLGNPRSRRENTIQMDIIAIRLISLDWINFPSIWTSGGLLWTRYRTFGSHNSGDLFTTWRTTNFSRKILFHWVRLQLKCDGTRWRTGGEVKGKLANGVGSQYPSHYLGTWCIHHYYGWCAHLGCQ